MGSSVDAGHAADVANKIRHSECGHGGQHDWKHLGQWPSSWGVCKKCGRTYFDK